MKKIKFIMVFAFIVITMCWMSFSVSATYYEPDGGSSDEYLFLASECNRVVNVTCVDQNGNTVKKVVYHTKYGEDDLISLSLYGYDISDFTSDQGLWETCKITWASGTGTCSSAYIQIRYYFRTSLSKSTLNATVTVRKSEAITVNVNHYLVDRYGTKTLYTADTSTIDYYDYVNFRANTITGYELDSSYASSISGNFSYIWAGQTNNIPSSPRPYSYNFVNTSLSEGMEEWSTYHESKQGKMDYCTDRVFTICFVYNLKSYTVSFNANGGTNTPGSIVKYYDVAAQIPVTVPTKSGYTFIGWGTNWGDTIPSYQPGENYYSNSGITLYAIWEPSTPTTYTVAYNANGGYGAPASQTKNQNVNLTLSSIIPTRQNYVFLGWSLSNTATSAAYSAGGIYTDNASAVLYAVWEKNNYEFSISDLTLSQAEIDQYGNLTIRVRTDSWDQFNAYSNISVELLFDESVIGTRDISFSVYGVSYVTFNLSVGAELGTHTVTVRINWDNRFNETNSNNNSVSDTINVKKEDYAESAEAVVFYDDYMEATTVISSFRLYNDGEKDILPEDNNTVRFTAYYYSGTQEIILSDQVWAQAVIPAGMSNLVYFKWTVPEGMAGQTVYCVCTANSDGSFAESDTSNNTAFFTKDVAAVLSSQTPDTSYKSGKPSGYNKANAPEESSDSVSWNMWVYENGAFTLKQYGIAMLGNSVVTPDSGCSTAVFEKGTWHMKSGYGITISFYPEITSVSGFAIPDSSAYTSAQLASAAFPEYSFLMSDAKYRTLEYSDGAFRFIRNSSADCYEKLHYIPVWVDNGEYVVSVNVTEVWTPAGKIVAVINSNAIEIDGSLYDDFYQN